MGTVQSSGTRSGNYFASYEPRKQGGVEAWGCVDDRFMRLLEARRNNAAEALKQLMANNPLNGLYLQLQGGASGLSANRAVAAETQQPGRFVKQGKGVDMQTGVLAAVLRAQGFEAVRHGGCGREAHANDIARRVINEKEPTFQVAQIIYPPLTSSRYEQHADSLARIQNAGLLRTDTESDHTLNNDWTEQDSGLVVPPVPKINLVEGPHVSSKFTVNHGRQAFDSRDAWQNGDPQYQLSFGRLPELHAAANRELGHVDEDLFLGAVAIDAAATARELEHLTGVTFAYNVVNV